ncbi:hypothetical protein ACS6G8_25245, partial [Enterobacter cloacae]|uniref:hypothetical protein n=1 Tax=Enterobacter cloacae TaxID=550 RepID=UPI003F4451BC
LKNQRALYMKHLATILNGGNQEAPGLYVGIFFFKLLGFTRNSRICSGSLTDCRNLTAVDIAVCRGTPN